MITPTKQKITCIVSDEQLGARRLELLTHSSPRTMVARSKIWLKFWRNRNRLSIRSCSSWWNDQNHTETIKVCMSERSLVVSNEGKVLWSPSIVWRWCVCHSLGFFKTSQERSIATFLWLLLLMLQQVSSKCLAVMCFFFEAFSVWVDGRNGVKFVFGAQPDTTAYSPFDQICGPLLLPAFPSHSASHFGKEFVNE